MTPYSLLRCVAMVAFVTTGLQACSGKVSPTATQITTIDKSMSCEALLLEINDAEYIRDTAMANRGLNARNILWPFGYPATYMSAEEAIKSADRRIAYLQKVYIIKDCERPIYHQ